MAATFALTAPVLTGAFAASHLQFVGATATQASTTSSSVPLPMSIGSPEECYHQLSTHAVGGSDWTSDSEPEGDPGAFLALPFPSGKVPSGHLAAVGTWCYSCPHGPRLRGLVPPACQRYSALGIRP
jgi:hypothetical protein